MRFKRRNEELFGLNVIDLEPYQLAAASLEGDQGAWEQLTSHYYRFGYVQDVREDEEGSHYDGQAFKKYNRKKSKEPKAKKKKDEETKK